MQLSNRNITDAQHTAHMMSLQLIRADLQKLNHRLITINLFLVDYRLIHGTTTECTGILRNMGIMPTIDYYKERNPS